MRYFKTEMAILYQKEAAAIRLVRRRSSLIIIFNNLDRSVSLERAILISINFCLAISKEESMMLPELPLNILMRLF